MGELKLVEDVILGFDCVGFLFSHCLYRDFLFLSDSVFRIIFYTDWLNISSCRIKV